MFENSSKGTNFLVVTWSGFCQEVQPLLVILTKGGYNVTLVNFKLQSR